MNAMGYWNNGMSKIRLWRVRILKTRVWRNEIYFYLDGTDQKIKSDHHPLLIPNIPFFHHSIIPWVI
jgi:hypothetical protein